MDELDRVSQYYVDKAKSKLAKTVMALKIKHKFQALRLRSKIQAHIRGSCSRYALRRMQKILEIERNASFKAEGLYSMQVARMGMLDIAKKLPIAQALIRGFVYRARYRNQKRDVTKLQAFVRMVICVKAKAAKLKQIVCLQRALRMLAIAWPNCWTKVSLLNSGIPTSRSPGPLGFSPKPDKIATLRRFRK